MADSRWCFAVFREALSVSVLPAMLIMAAFGFLPGCQTHLDKGLEEGRPSEHRIEGMESQRMVELGDMSRAQFKFELQKAFGANNLPRMTDHPSRNAVLISASPSQHETIDRILVQMSN